MADIVLLHDKDGDWVAMYVDGYLRDEGHSLSEGAVIDNLIGKTIDSLTEYEFDFKEIGKGYEALDQYDYTDLRQW